MPDASLDGSYAYLEANPQLEDAVGKALVEVINSRAVDPLQKMVEELLAQSPSSTPKALLAAAPPPPRVSKDANGVEAQAFNEVNQRLTEVMKERDLSLGAKRMLEEKVARVEGQAEAAKGQAEAARMQVEEAKKQRLAAEQEVSTLKSRLQAMAELERKNQQLEQRCAELEQRATQLQSRVNAAPSALAAASRAASLVDEVPPAAPPLPAAPSYTAPPPVPPPAAEPPNPAAEVMERLFDAIARFEGGDNLNIPTAKVRALQRAFRSGCDDERTDEKERSAIFAFLAVLDEIVGDSERVRREVWVGHRPPEGTYSAAQLETLTGILSTVLDTEEALTGLLYEMEGGEGEEGEEGEESSNLADPDKYVSVMTELYDRVLDRKPQAGVVVAKRVQALARALKEGCDESPDPEETKSMVAFIAVLTAMTANGARCTRDEWIHFNPSAGAYTPAQENTIMDILTTVLKEDEPTEGLVEVIEEFEREM